MSKKIISMDTTLRDGEQMPGVVFTPDQKSKLAEKIMDIGIDFLDVMPVVSQEERRLGAELSKKYGDRVTASCRSKHADIDASKACGINRVNLIVPSSDIHLEHKFGITRDENVKRSKRIIEYCDHLGMKPNIVLEDATRADEFYLQHLVDEFSEYTDTFFLPDTVGSMTPNKSYKFFKKFREYVKDGIFLGTHAHNDFGMATANTVESVRGGADVISGTFTGIGERGGNAPLEEVYSTLKWLEGFDLDIDYKMFKEVCDMVQEYSGVKLQSHKPVVGYNAFSHESGAHVCGVLRNPMTYEPFDPEEVGQERRFIVGKYSGRNIIRHYLGDDVDDERVDYILGKVKGMSAKLRRSLTRDELENVLSQHRKSKS